LKAGGWRRAGTMYRAGDAWETLAVELPGGFRNHRTTVVWTRRLLDPAGFLAPSVYERAEQMLEQLSAGQLEKWRAEKDRSLRQLYRNLFAAVVAPEVSVEARRAAYELMISDPEDALPEAYNNLLVLYLDALADLDRASAFLPIALENAPRNPLIYYNAACLLARTGDVEQAIEMLGRAKDGGALTPSLVEKAAANPDFASICDDQRFGAVLGEKD